MKTTLLICIDEQALSETSRGLCCGVSAATLRNNQTAHEIEHTGVIEAVPRCADRAEHRRRKLLRETERYLNNPHSKPWALVIRARSSGMARVWQESPAASSRLRTGTCVDEN